MITNEYLTLGKEVTKDSFAKCTELKVRLKTYEECQEILGEELFSVCGMVPEFRQHIQQSSKDNPLEYVIRYNYDADKTHKNTLKGKQPVKIILHPFASKSYVGTTFEADLFETIQENTFKGL